MNQPPASRTSSLLTILDDRQVEELIRCANNPAAFAALRKALIDGFLNALDAERRAQAECLQAEIDATRLTAATPLRAFRQVMDMLGDRTDALEALDARMKIVEGEPHASKSDSKNANSRGDMP